MSNLKVIVRKMAIVYAVGQGGVTPYELSAMTNLSNVTCRVHLRRLTNEGFLNCEKVMHRKNVTKEIFNVKSCQELDMMLDYYNVSIPRQLRLWADEPMLNDEGIERY